MRIMRRGCGLLVVAGVLLVGLVITGLVLILSPSGDDLPDNYGQTTSSPSASSSPPDDTASPTETPLDGDTSTTSAAPVHSDNGITETPNADDLAWLPGADDGVTVLRQWDSSNGKWIKPAVTAVSGSDAQPKSICRVTDKQDLAYFYIGRFGPDTNTAECKQGHFTWFSQPAAQIKGSQQYYRYFEDVELGYWIRLTTGRNSVTPDEVYGVTSIADGISGISASDTMYLTIDPADPGTSDFFSEGLNTHADQRATQFTAKWKLYVPDDDNPLGRVRLSDTMFTPVCLKTFSTKSCTSNYS